MFFKDTLRLIKKTIKRFLTIFLMVFIGVSFMVGLLATPPIMYKSVDDYFDEYNLDILSFDCFVVDLFEKQLADDCTQAELSMISAEEYLTFEPTVWRKAYKRSVFIDNNIKFPERLWYEDLATVCNLAPYVNRIGYLNKKLYYYVQHPNSITHSSNTTRMMEIVNAFDIVEAYFKNNGYFERYYAELEWLCVKHVLYYSAHRFLTKGYYRKQMNILYNYVCSHFPDFMNNKYVVENSPTTYCMNRIINRRFFGFYFKNCIVPWVVNFCRKIFPDK